MRIFLDSTNTGEIKEALSYGLINGVMTNACHSTYSSKDDFFVQVEEIIKICSIADLPVMIDVITDQASDIVMQVIDMSRQLNYNFLVFKIPIGFEMLKPIRSLNQREGIHLNIHCCVNTTQMQCAAITGAHYVSLSYADAQEQQDDNNPYQLPAGGAVLRTKSFIYHNKLQCHVVADNLATPEQVGDAWSSGADLVVVSYDLLKQLINHDKTKDIIQKYRQRFQEWMT